MRAGKLNKKVSIETKVETGSADGGIKTAWQPRFTGVWAAIEPLKGREWHDAGGTQSEVDTRIRIRYRPGVKAGMRVVFKDRTFDVQYPADVRSKNRELHLMCKEYSDG